MATPKSANERIRRKLRTKKVSPKGKDFEGRVEVKKSGNNDPRRNKRKMSEEFLDWYKGSKTDDPIKFKGLIENLIAIGVEAANKINFPFSLMRLNELRESIDASNVGNVVVDNMENDDVRGKH